jgi:phosphoglycerate dehydrogenase-like enzyme
VGADRVRFVDDLDELLELSDHVVLAAPLTAATRGMLGAERFARFRPGAHLVNIARGGLVDHDALLAALTDGRVGRASLDVTEPEPLPADHPLRAHPGVFLSPHVSWSGQTRFVEILLDNVGRWTAGEPLLNRVDLDQGY